MREHQSYPPGLHASGGRGGAVTACGSESISSNRTAAAARSGDLSQVLWLIPSPAGPCTLPTPRLAWLARRKSTVRQVSSERTACTILSSAGRERLLASTWCFAQLKDKRAVTPIVHQEKRCIATMADKRNCSRRWLDQDSPKLLTKRLPKKSCDES